MSDRAALSDFDVVEFHDRLDRAGVPTANAEGDTLRLADRFRWLLEWTASRRHGGAPDPRLVLVICGVLARYSDGDEWERHEVAEDVADAVWAWLAEGDEARA